MRVHYSRLFFGSLFLLTGCVADIEPDIASTQSPLCSTEVNADEVPTGWLPVESVGCYDSQFFEATSPHDGLHPCGFVVAVGAYNKLLRPAHYTLRGRWAEPPTTQSECNRARTQATAWGFGCWDSPCRFEQWHPLGTTLKNAYWNHLTHTCETEVVFEMDANFKAIEIAVQPEERVFTGPRTFSWETVRATGSVQARKPNGTCFQL